MSTGLDRLLDIPALRRPLQGRRLALLAHPASVTADLTHALDALAATFPAGTLSGAPKIRAMEIIDELEPVSRGLYGGAIGYLDLRGNLDFCIAIRTLTMNGGRATLQAGAGIVADSDADAEYQECLDKAQAFRRYFNERP